MGEAGSGDVNSAWLRKEMEEGAKEEVSVTLRKVPCWVGKFVK